jgi:transcription elongation factor GreB
VSARRSHYITAEGFETLKKELDQLWKVERPRVTLEVSLAAAQGDRSENAEYIYGKKRLREIDARLRFLQKRIDDLEVVREAPPTEDRVFFGAWVTIEDEAGEVHRYRVVGPDEFDIDRGYISIDSPMGIALMRKELGDEVVVRRPKGDGTYTIEAIEYEPPG